MWKLDGYMQMYQRCVIWEKVPHKTDKSPVDSIYMRLVHRSLFKTMREYRFYCFKNF